MTSPHIILSTVALALAGSGMLAINASGHAGQDHERAECQHGKQQSLGGAADIDSIKIEPEVQLRHGIETAEVPTRKIGAGVAEVSALPKASVFTQGVKKYVFALPDGAEERFEKWEVTLGESDDFFVEIKTGVFPGDRIVIAGVAAILQLETAAEKPTEEIEEEDPPEAPANAIAETGDPAGTTAEVEGTQTCPLERKSPCLGAGSPCAFRSAPVYFIHRHEFDVVVEPGFADPHYHGYRIEWPTANRDECVHGW